MIGGGDTGSDCVGTSIRQGASSVTQLELLPRPPEQEDKSVTWPNWPVKLRSSSSHEEGCGREWSLMTKSFSGENGSVGALNVKRLEWIKDQNQGLKMNEVTGSEAQFKADLVLLAMGFTHPIHVGLLEELGVKFNISGKNKPFTASQIRNFLVNKQPTFEVFSDEKLLPAVGQGAIALQCRINDKKTLKDLLKEQGDL